MLKSVHRAEMPRLTPNAAAERCGQSRATILRAIAAKDLPAEKQGGQWAIERDTLDQWAAQRPQRARRKPLKGSLRVGGAENSNPASTAPLSVSVSDSAAERKEIERLEALKALCEALQVVCEGLRADVEALQQQVVDLSAKAFPETPAAASGSTTTARRRLWPF